jgi:hypothetical protein
MFTIAGAPLIPTWEWRCPSCRKLLRERHDGNLAARARSHYLAEHGPIDGQMSLLEEEM